MRIPPFHEERLARGVAIQAASIDNSSIEFYFVDFTQMPARGRFGISDISHCPPTTEHVSVVSSRYPLEAVALRHPGGHRSGGEAIKA